MYLRKDFKIPLLVREPGSGIRDTLVEFCIRGQGVLFLPSVQAAPFISSGKLFELSIKDIEFKRDYFFPIIIKNISPRVCSASQTIFFMTLCTFPFNCLTAPGKLPRY